jgi:hypothetical protein
MSFVPAEKQKAIALANLNQLQYVVSPDTGDAYAELPSSRAVRHEIAASLSVIGFDISSEFTDPQEVHVTANGRAILLDDNTTYHSVVVGMDKGDTLEFSMKGAQKLLAAGVKSATLQALADPAERVPASKAALRQ